MDPTVKALTTFTAFNIKFLFHPLNNIVFNRFNSQLKHGHVLVLAI